MWIPDVYQGAPRRGADGGRGAQTGGLRHGDRLLVEGMFPLAMDWQGMLVVLAVLSIGLGNLAAIAQTNLKRMLATPTIAQIGFVLLALLSACSTATGSPPPPPIAAPCSTWSFTCSPRWVPLA
jgi:NADH dehydrogenase subunit N (EC 1.6.5.3)